MGIKDCVRPRCSALAFAVAILTSAAAPARAHDPYTSWQQPGSGISCCNGEDCQVSRAYHDGKRWMAEFEGEFVPVPEHAVLDPSKIPNPDGNAHLCAKRFNGLVLVFCFRRPEVRM